MPESLHVISSMATRALLGDLALAWQARSPLALHVESVGGVDAARRVQAGEAFDLVVLAANAIDQLADSGQVLPGSRVDLVHSGVAVAVRAGAPEPDIGSEDALRQAVLAARTVGYSTGPSGVALLRLFERWGIAPLLQGRLVQAPAGVPVGSLVAGGDVELGFQQLSELMHVDGIRVIGPLPAAVQITTTFSGGVAASCRQPAAAREVLAWMAGPEASEFKRRHGMDAA